MVGAFEVERVIIRDGLPKDIKKFWNEVQEKAGIEYQQFYNYYKGASVGVGIFINNLDIFTQPVKLERLRKKLPYLKPPQNYRYMTDKELALVKSLAQ